METDYLVIGAGAMGLAFVDELVTRTDAHITIVDKRHAPGGHWNDAYAFVRLHQPSLFYGVESKELSEYRIDQSGSNAGFLSLAAGSEVVSYFHALMRERLLPSGRVQFLPMCEVGADGSVRSLLSRQRIAITVRKKIVDAAYLTNSIPLTHTRRFNVAAGVTCVPPNDLPRVAAHHPRFVVLGAGKTGLDACCWLIEHGAPPDAVRWVIPRDHWYVNRAGVQPGPEFFARTFGMFAAGYEALGMARSLREYTDAMEAAGVWLRVDRSIEPTVFHAPTISEGELEQVRRIRDVVRLGRVTSLHADRIVLEQGEVAAYADTLYVDCTAPSLARTAPTPVFSEGRVKLQMVRFPQLPFSAALIGFLESTIADDAEKNRLAAPFAVSDTVEDYIRLLSIDMQNRLQCSRHPDVRAWINQSRTDGFAKLMRDIGSATAENLAVIERLREALKQATQNLPHLTATLPPHAATA